MRISDVLRRKGAMVVTIAPDESVGTLLQRLVEHRIGAMVVSHDGAAVQGIVSERDVVVRLQSDGPALLDRRVAEIMTSGVHTCEPDAQVVDMARLMTEERVRHVPVVSEGRLVGIVSIGDIVKQRIDELQSERDYLTEYISR